MGGYPRLQGHLTILGTLTLLLSTLPWCLLVTSSLPWLPLVTLGNNAPDCDVSGFKGTVHPNPQYCTEGLGNGRVCHNHNQPQISVSFH